MTQTKTKVEQLRGCGYGVVEDGSTVIVVVSKARKTRAVRFESPRIAVRQLVERRHLCSHCGVQLTAADRDAGKCAQCFEPVMEPIRSPLQ